MKRMNEKQVPHNRIQRMRIFCNKLHRIEIFSSLHLAFLPIFMQEMNPLKY